MTRVKTKIGGMQTALWLRERDISAKTKDQTWVPLKDIWTHPKGHPLRHLRIEDPVDEAFINDIILRGVQEPILVRIGHIPAKKRSDADETVLELVDGAQRYNNALAAQKLLQDQKDRRLDDEGNLYVPVAFFKGDDRELLKARQRADQKPFWRPHSVRVLALTAIQMEAQSVPFEEIVEVMPRDAAKPGIVNAMILGWHSLTEESKQAFESGEVPVGLLPTVTTAARENQAATIAYLLEKGAQTPAAATRAMHALEAEREANAAFDEHDEERRKEEEDRDDDDDEDGDEGEDDEDDDEGEKPVLPPVRLPSCRLPQERSRTEKVRPARVRAIFDLMEIGKVQLSPEAKAFASGMALDLGECRTEGLSKEAQEIMRGALFRRGKLRSNPPQEIQRLLEQAALKPQKSPGRRAEHEEDDDEDNEAEDHDES